MLLTQRCALGLSWVRAETSAWPVSRSSTVTTSSVLHSQKTTSTWVCQTSTNLSTTMINSSSQENTCSPSVCPVVCRTVCRTCCKKIPWIGVKLVTCEGSECKMKYTKILNDEYNAFNLLACLILVWYELGMLANLGDMTTSLTKNMKIVNSLKLMYFFEKYEKFFNRLRLHTHCFKIRKA